MNIFGLLLFGSIFLLFTVLDIAMVVSLIQTGDERRQVIVLKAAASTLIIAVGMLLFSVVENIAVGYRGVNPYTTLQVLVVGYFISLLYYKRKYGN